MLLIDWFRNLKWICAIRRYDFLMETTRRQAADIGQLRDKNAVLQRDLDTERMALTAKGSMARMAEAISQRFNEERRLQHDHGRIQNGVRMSDMSKHQEKLLMIELETLRKKIKYLEDRKIIPRTIHGTEDSGRPSF